MGEISIWNEFGRSIVQPIRRRNKPQCKIEYHGITYESKRDFSRKKKISVGCIHEMMVNNNVDFETAADIYWR